MYSRRRHHSPVLAIMDPDDDVRENIIHYDEEGVGKFTPITTTTPKQKNLNTIFFNSNGSDAPWMSL